MATRIDPFSSQHLEAACRVLADTERGLSGTQIERLLQEIQVADTSPGMTKWKRLFNALAGAQNQHQVGNHLIMFINRAMNPVNYAREPATYAWRRDELNVVLAFSGFYVREDGKVAHADKATTLDAARGFLASSELKTAMQTAGVKGMPQMWVTREAPGSSGRDGKVRLFVQHTVASYGDWRKVYLDFAPVQKKMGVQAQAVYWQADNANNLVITHDFASADKARAFVASNELRTTMQGAGVKGMPQVWFTRRALK